MASRNRGIRPLPRIDERQDVRVLELCRETDLAQEPLGAEDGGKLGAEHLDRDQAVVLHIASEIDRGHPAAAEFARDCVAAGEGGLQAREDLVHLELSLFRASSLWPRNDVG